MFERVRAGAARGDAEAQYHLGPLLLRYGREAGTTGSLALVSEECHARVGEAKYSLATVCTGFGVTRDVNLRRFSTFEAAADQGNPQARANWPRIVLRRQGFAVESHGSVRLYGRPPIRGDASASTSGLPLSHGAAEERDYAEAARCALTGCREEGCASGRLPGRGVSLGRGVARDSAEATEWYGKAARSGRQGRNLFLGWRVFAR